MSRSNKKKSEQLGMPHGTAGNRLRKMILFSLVQKLDEDKCYRCGELIKDVAELSIEHIEPWLDVNVDLFWDLDNIAFSHQSCNSVNNRGNDGAGDTIRNKIKNDADFAAAWSEKARRGAMTANKRHNA